MKTWVVSDYADNSLLKMMQNPTNISDEDVLNIEKFVILMYDRMSQVTSINNARLELFAAKNRTLENIPPTRASLVQHICRSALQASCWEQMFSAIQILPDPTSCGCEKSSDGVWCLEVSESLRIPIKCSCQKTFGCKKECKCAKDHLNAPHCVCVEVNANDYDIQLLPDLLNYMKHFL